MTELTTSPVSAGSRMATGETGARIPAVPLDPEVTEQAKRRRFTAEYKLRILREADACKGDGDLGALLRREGLYSSSLASWRRQRDEIAKVGLKACRRGPKSKAVDPRVKRLERENARLRRRLEEAETIIDFQKKLSKLLGIPLKSPDSEGND
jgi:transposase-like protein